LIRIENPITYIALAGFSFTTSLQVTTSVLSLYLFKELGASTSEIGIIFAIFSIASLLFRVLMVFILPGVQLSYLLLAGLLTNMMAAVGYYAAEAIGLFILFRVIHGLAVALDNTVMLTLASLSAPKGRETSTAVARYTAAVALGLMTGPAIATLSVTLFGLRASFLVASLASVPSVVASYLFIRATRGIWIGQITRVSIAEFRNLIRGVGIRIASVIFFLFSIAYGVFVAYAPLVAEVKYGLANNVITSLFFGYFIISFTLRSFLSRLLNRFSMTKLLSASLSAVSISLFLMWISPSPLLFAIAFVMMGMGHGFVFPITAIIAARTTPPSSRINGNAIYLASWDVGFLIGPSVAAALSLYLAPHEILMMIIIAPLTALYTTRQIHKTGIE